MTDSTLAPGSILHGKYHVDRLIASGGTSRIYAGHPLKGAGLVAIKQFCPAADATEEDLLLFHREFQILEKLDHPGIPRVVDFVHEEEAREAGDDAEAEVPRAPGPGQFFIVEEYIAGETLEDRILRQGRLESGEAAKILASILEILAYLHEHGIIFRDLKSSNVLLAPGDRVRLIDFGAARRHRPRASRDTVPLGTPGFAAPEQYGTAQTDARSDVFSAGAVSFHMLTGQNPSDRAPWDYSLPADLGVPHHVRASLGKAVALDPARRFESATAFRRQLTGLGVRKAEPDDKLLGRVQHVYSDAPVLGRMDWVPRQWHI